MRAASLQQGQTPTPRPPSPSTTLVLPPDWGPSPGTWIHTVGMLRPPSLVGCGGSRAALDKNHGQRHAHPQASAALTAPRQRLGDVSVRSSPPCMYQPSSKWEQGPVSTPPPWSQRPPSLGRSKEKFLASSILPTESLMVRHPDRTHDGKGKANPAGGGRGVSLEGLEQSSSHRRDGDQRGQGQKDGDKSCSKAAQVNLRWRRTT